MCSAQEWVPSGGLRTDTHRSAFNAIGRDEYYTVDPAQHPKLPFQGDTLSYRAY